MPDDLCRVLLPRARARATRDGTVGPPETAARGRKHTSRTARNSGARYRHDINQVEVVHSIATSAPGPRAPTVTLTAMAGR